MRTDLLILWPVCRRAVIERLSAAGLTLRGVDGTLDGHGRRHHGLGRYA